MEAVAQDSRPVLSKVAKKRAAKRRRNAAQELDERSEPISLPKADPRDLLSELIAEFQRAKEGGDLEKARTLRQHIWLAQDIAAGVKPCVTDDEIASLAAGIIDFKPKKSFEVTTTECSEEQHIKASPRAQIDHIEKQLRKLQKKHTQIQVLKGRLEKGDKLEQTQILKINREKQLEDEIDDLEDKLHKLKRM